MNHLPDDFELLQSRIDTLEKRVGKLEQKSEMPVEPATPQTFAASSPVIESLTVESASGIFPVLGKALLGVAGAYVLRALADSSVFPQQAVAAIAVVYAIAWLAGAVKATTSRALAGGVYAATSAVILAPMLWELTLRFNLLPPELDAVIL